MLLMNMLSTDRIPSALHCAVCHLGQLRGHSMNFTMRPWGGSVATKSNVFTSVFTSTTDDLTFSLGSPSGRWHRLSL